MPKRLKIAIIGYGKMGKMIETIAQDKGHNIHLIIDVDATENDWNKLSDCDVAIEFSRPESAVNNILKCFESKVPVVVGTTGWYNAYDQISNACKQYQGALMTATNFSIGVNLFFHINKILAQAMNNLPEYNVSIQEIHHTQKLDAPSGTAITIAQGVLNSLSRKSEWVLSNEYTSENQLSIDAIRKDDVPGTHSVTYSSAIDDIEIKHTAHNRSGFAIGAVVAAEWMVGKKGVFTMNDLIGF
jgi:4-hydroxy-tetrahydrodipicolinate reductase